jgi:hypothetical protein
MSALGQKQTSLPKKKRDRHNGRSPQSPALAFGNDRRRRGLALAVVRSGLCGGRDAEERLALVERAMARSTNARMVFASSMSDLNYCKCERGVRIGYAPADRNGTPPFGN